MTHDASHALPDFEFVGIDRPRERRSILLRDPAGLQALANAPEFGEATSRGIHYSPFGALAAGSWRYLPPIFDATAPSRW